MVDKHARVVTQPSNRQKDKDAKQNKVVYKAVLDNPFRIQWPSVPVNLQNAILRNILHLLDGISEYQLQNFIANRKRKRKKLSVNTSSNKQSKENLDTPGERMEDIPSSEPVNVQDGAALVTGTSLNPPVLFRHLVYGINALTKRLEKQTWTARRPVITTVPEQPQDFTPALKYIFVCRNDVNVSVLIDHLPHLVAAYNSCRPPSFVTLVPLPKGAEFFLAEALGIRRVTTFGIDVGAPSKIIENKANEESTLKVLYPEQQSLKTLLDKVPILTASWLSQTNESRPLIPTHLKQLRTTAPKDMKAAKEKRNAERAQAKQRKRAKLNDLQKAMITN